MQNLSEGLKSIITDVIYEEDIKNIVLLLREELHLERYIDVTNPVEFNFETFHGLSLENTIDYSEYEKKLSVNMSVLNSKLSSINDISDRVLNWMKLLYEIFYIMEDVQIIKYLNENKKNNVTKIIGLYEDFKANKASLSEFNKYLHNFKSDQITKNEVIEDPIDRIKKIHAYFYTLDVFKKMHLNSYYMEKFKSLFTDELLKGYSINNQNIYPLRNVFFQNSYIDGSLYMMNFPWFKNESMVSLSNATENVPRLEERLALGYPIESVEYNLIRRNKI